MRDDNRNSRSDSNRGDRRFGGRNFNNRGFGNNRGFSDQQKYQAVCSACGEDCQVPFKPSGSKPVYCDNCFGKNKNRGIGPSRNFDNRQQKSYDSGQYKEQLNAINTKIDKILEILQSTPQVKAEVKKEKKVVKQTEKKPEKKKAKK
ncbi:MAG: CxxC-x17-CxxC domain-containing protein [Candidatus Kuenenbacteria bacterium]